MTENNNYVLITGASSGIGKALAEEYAKRGYNLILTARRADQLQHTKDSCLQISPKIKVELIVADVAQNNFKQILQDHLKEVKNLSYVFVNAGVGSAGRFEKLQIEDFKRVLDINVIGAVQTVQGSLDAIKISKGRIVIIASLNSFFALPLGSPYNISKFAVKALGQSLDAELAPYGIKVSIVYPGPVKTDIVATDNKGRPKPEAKDFFAKQPSLPAPTAARIIAKKLQCGRREFSLTFSTSLAIWLQQRFPETLSSLIRVIYCRFEKKFVDLVRIVNPDSV